jgi:phospholipase/carboxylesterase
MVGLYDREGGLHRDVPVRHAGRALEDAGAAMIMLHGRGATADDILTLVHELRQDSFAYLAPQAANFAWYPYSFLAPLERNEPWLSSALDLIASILDKIVQTGIPQDRIMLLGFSQGACLALEYAARNPGKYGGLVGFSGGLIGPLGIQWGYSGSLEKTPVFLGCSDVDPHIPKQRILETADALRKMDAQVEYQLYPGMGHIVNMDEISRARQIMQDLLPL